MKRPSDTTRERVRKMEQEGLPVRAIAAMLGITTQAVYQHLARIRQDDQTQQEAAS